MSTTEGADVDRYLKESVKSYKECSVKNTARRNSLQKKTLGIESERRLASSKMTREERLLKEQLRHLNIEKAKNHLVHNLRDAHEHDHHRKTGREEKKHHALPIPVEPYPITFRETPSTPDLDRQHEDSGQGYSAMGQRRRRQSREFEDLSLNTRPQGPLFNIQEFTDEESPRRRTNSMSAAHQIMARKHLISSRHSSRSSTPAGSPKLQRTRKTSTGSKNCSNSSGSSKESLHDSKERIHSLNDLRWIGEPEAIHSIRRPRLTVDQQELELEIHKLSVS
ncbi:uncharacterized protein LOC127857145 [Dreissena polymorpha]|uniref:Uncharacterized protein n=2 Tax=Dreissena polymorpha TaxID=45954 RepID=A0A9D4BSS5_DREPO|nr:uncharacterized protein LOC127857145 [Dreissena polymorpha]XP_052249489.1 uncharacterized protein LOC127857145 [Dreissena polymorpha]XP_052249490.1 uncharacterized protein LOC127857145 [Dreissena polymorpha]XP_052249491.1 uncharacterized protein LOC127857145 [Dreissena polymorpha]XP_052249492.1 uncharacterized protein LOC127857145 [Dreissena polymorpha]XP_052249493.1 uncharacterized protein LOC127857145 [Dreissena polymorpha]KAH3706877.1 hypothetical protein DPMN_066268 [Dreissena polymorp